MERSGRRSSARTARPTLLLALAFALGLTVSACGGGDSANGDASASDDGDLDFVAETLDGAQIDAGDLEGQDVVLWFWAPW